MDKVEGFRESDYSLAPVHTAVWDGHIFINLSLNPIPFEEHLAGLQEKLARSATGTCLRCTWPITDGASPRPL